MQCIECGKSFERRYPKGTPPSYCSRKCKSKKDTLARAARYHADPEFREKCKAASKAHWAKHRVEYEKRYSASARKASRKRAGIIDPTGEKRTGQCPTCPYFGPLELDHWHEGPKAGQVRDWICGACNRTLGQAKDNTMRLHNLIAYIAKHSA